MTFNLLDYIILAILIGVGIKGFTRGFIKATASILGVLLGIYAGSHYNEILANYLQQHFLLQTFIADRINKYASAHVFTGDIPSFDFSGSLKLFQDPSQYMARLIMLALSFILLVFVISTIISILAGAVSRLISTTGLSWLNRSTGMALAIGKYTIILAVIVGIIHPVITAGSKIGVEKALSIAHYMDGSLLVGSLLKIFTYICTIAGAVTNA